MPPSPAERVTVGEIGRRMGRLEDEFHSGIAGLHRRLDELNYVHPETLDTKLLLEQAHRADLERRVVAMEAARAKEEDERATNRRLAVAGIATGLILPIIVVVLLSSMGYR
jgi:hypothetical protein